MSMGIGSYPLYQKYLVAVHGQWGSQDVCELWFIVRRPGRKPLGSVQIKALSELRQRTDVKWTYISPAADFQAEGARTGEYILVGEELTLNKKGESIISYADFAAAMADEIAGGGHILERISVVRK